MTHKLSRDFVYDLETYINCFTAVITHVPTRTRFIFEVSDRRNQSAALIKFLYWIRDMNGRMFGYNNVGFDYTVLHHLIIKFEYQKSFTAHDAYLEAQKVINTPWNDRHKNLIYANNRYLIQGDLMLIHHFDNVSKITSLKKLEINMQSHNVVDLPFDPHLNLTFDEMDELIKYNCHDTSETLKFYHHTVDQITFRDDMKIKYPDLGDVLNFNDPKIGESFFIRELENRMPGVCYKRVGGRKVPNNTLRSTIVLNDVISPKIYFNMPEFQAILDRFRSSIIVETKGAFDDMTCTVGGMEFVFGVGGLHGSLHAVSVYPDDEYDLVDVDVASYYPNLAISNRFYPEHLSDAFCDIYQDVYNMRQSYAKKTAENAMLKLALNGVYGKSGSRFSPFFDTKYMMSITINGQLMICMLAEWAMNVGAKMVQVNTDGITCRVPKVNRALFDQMINDWEIHTGLELEAQDYKAMHIANVNSYIAVKQDGSRKRIKSYCHENTLENPYTRELMWHKNHSKKVVALAAEAKLVDGVDIAEFIMSHKNPYDFSLSVKIPRGSRLEQRWADGRIEPTQNMCRYYVSTSGCALTKIMPPLAKNPGVERAMSIEKGWTVKVINNMDDFSFDDVNWLYYITEAKKITSWVQ